MRLLKLKKILGSASIKSIPNCKLEGLSGLMSVWGELNFQDGAALLQEHLANFHDFTILVLTLIISFVTTIIYLIAQKGFIDKRLSAHHALEFLWTLLPVFVLITIAVPSLTLLFMIEDSSESFLRRKAVGYQWYWHYDSSSLRNPEGYDSYMVATNSGKPEMFRLLDTTNYLRTPVGVSSRVLITSGDVLHSWTVPALGVKADACPGRLNEVILRPMRTGTFYGQCSEICGRNHRFMPIETKVLATNYWASLN